MDLDSRRTGVLGFASMSCDLQLHLLDFFSDARNFSGTGIIRQQLAKHIIHNVLDANVTS